MLRTIGAVVVGIFLVGVVVFVLQQISASMHPLPAGLDPMNPADQEAFMAHLAAMPVAAWLIAFFSEILGAFCGAWVAAFIARSRAAGVAAVIVTVALVGSIMNWTSFSHPLWFIVGQLIGYPIAYFAVLRLTATPTPSTGDSA